jgi:hypothetical protein
MALKAKQFIKNQTTKQRYNNQNRRKSLKEQNETRIGTHLTIIGVCTTTLPEKSGT